MDTPSALLRPRLRLFRRSPSPRFQDGDATPQPAPSSARALDEDEFPTPRIHPKPITDPYSTAAPVDTPAARLRALLAREPRTPRATTTPPPGPSSDADSVADSARFGSSTSSVARDSLKDIFSRALREPGDTPQKGRPRRNSFDGSSMEITPVVERDRGRRRATRRSLSDEEAEKPKPNERPDPSFRLSTALTFDILRARLAASRSQLIDQNPPEAIYDHSSTVATSTSHSQHHTQATTSTRINALAPHPSFQMSSQLGFQSNLLDQDSEMQRAMGDVLSSENEALTATPNVAQSTLIPSGSCPPSSLQESKNGPKLDSRRKSYELDFSTTSSAVNGVDDREHRSQQEERNHQRERDWNRPRLPSRSGTPEMHYRHSQEFHRQLSQEFRSPPHSKPLSHESTVSPGSAARPAHRHLERRGSLVSLRSFDDDHSSRPSSIGSQADYRDRISELDREKNYEREREWDRRHPPSRPSSSLSTSSNNSFSHSHPPRSPSATPYQTPTLASLQRRSSRTSLRSDSPASLTSSRGSLKEREEEEKKEEVHERERNWNSPRPHWSTSKSPSASHHKIRNKDDNSLRASSSLPHLRNSLGYGDASRVSARPQSMLPRVDSSAVTSPALSGDRSNSGLEETIGITPSARSKHTTPSKSPGASSRFGWNFARSPLPPLELDDSEDRRRDTSSPPLGSRPSSMASEAMSSQIPVRSRIKGLSSVAHPTSDMSLTHVVGDDSSFQPDYENKPSEAVELYSRREPPAVRDSSGRDDILLGSDEESVVDFPPQSTTPKSKPPNLVPEGIETDTETEVLTSPQGSPQLGVPASVVGEPPHQKMNDPPRSQTPDLPPEGPPARATPPGTPPSATPKSVTSELSPSFALVTPPRGTSFGNSTLDFRTPSPPHDLPDLPGPPSSSDDDALENSPTKYQRIDVNLNSTLTKTPKPPGAWAATPQPPKFGHWSTSPRDSFPLESTPPAFTSTPLPRANSQPPIHSDTTNDDGGEDGFLTPVPTLSRARSLPLRTPAPPGAWVATPGQSALLNNGADQSQFGSLGRKKGLLKVRFDVAESENSATEGHSNSPLSAIRLTNPELPLPKQTTDHGPDSSVDEFVNEFPQLMQPSTVSHRPATPERPTTPISREHGPSPRSVRKSPSVRLVDAYGRERADEEGITTSLIGLPNGYADAERKMTPSPPAPRRSLVRVVDAMGREVDDDAVEIPDPSRGGAHRLFETDLSIVLDDSRIGHAEALARMRRTLRDLAESLSDTDRSEDLELNSTHLEQLEEVSKVARLARNQLAQNLQLETAKEHDLRHDNKSSSWTRGLLPITTKQPRNTIIIFCGVIIQLLFFLAMWRYAHAEARRLFYTTYYDPLYPEFTPLQESSCFSGTLSTSRPWTILDSYETIRREGWWSIRNEILHAMRHVGDQAWERWGENAHFEKPT